MLIPAVFALLCGLAFFALWLLRRPPGAIVAAIAWLAYAPYEWLMHARVLCSGECNIRVDLLLIWPLLVIVSLAGPVRAFIRYLKARRQTHAGR